jgi:para-aminobenzoate synthetase component 1
MIKDKNYSIISCSPENLITKKVSISTKPIAGTVKKNKN